MNVIPASLGVDLPELRSFRTQVSGEDASIPDLAGFDGNGRVRLLVENKFWAGLTPNQPSAYLERLPEYLPGLLLFVVPQRRLHTIWSDLVSSAAKAGVAIPPSSVSGANLISARMGVRTLAVTSWGALLDRFEGAGRDAGEHSMLTEVSQVGGVGEEVDTSGDVPAWVEELTNEEVPRRLMAVAGLIPELCDRAIAAGIADGKGLRPTHFWHGAGRYLRIGTAGGWIGIDHRHWARFGSGPLWITFGANDYGRGPAVLSAVAPWLASNPVRAFEADGAVTVPLRIAPNATRDAVLDDLLSQMTELHSLLRDLGEATVPSIVGPPAIEAA